MNKQDYMISLKKHLRRLPKEDFQKAVEYFEEYFADAGIEKERQAIEDLGSPESAADQIIKSFALSNIDQPVKNVKKGMNAVWVGLLAVCALPIGLPLAFAFGLTILLILIAILFTLVMFLLSGILLMLTGPVCVIAGFTVIPYSLPAFISCLGQGLLIAGLGLLITFGMFKAIRSFLAFVVRLIGNFIKRKDHKI